MITNKQQIHLIEKLFLIGLINNKKFLLKFIENVKVYDFDRSIYSKIFSIIKSHWYEYKSQPSYQTFLTYYYKKLLNDSEAWVAEEFLTQAYIEVPLIDYDFLEVEFIEQIKERRKNYLASVIASNKWDREKINKLSNIIDSIETIEEATGFSERIDEWGERRLNSIQRSGRVHTGIPQLDLVSGGGILPGEYCMFLGPTGSGKSTLMQNICYSALHYGETKGVHFTTENPIQTVMDRYIVRFLEKPLFQIEQLAEARYDGDLIKCVKEELKEKGYRWDIEERLHFHDIRGEKALGKNISIFLERLIEREFVPNFIIVDDIDNMLGNISYNARAPRVEQLNEASRALKDIAADYNLVVFAIGQMNPKGYGDDDIHLGRAGSYSKAAKEQIPGGVFFNHQKKEEQKADPITGLCYSRLEAAKTRNFPKFDGMITLVHDYKIQKITVDETNNSTQLDWGDMSDDQVNNFF